MTKDKAPLPKNPTTNLLPQDASILSTRAIIPDHSDSDNNNARVNDRNLTCFDRNNKPYFSPRLRTPKKMMMARFAAESSSLPPKTRAVPITPTEELENDPNVGTRKRFRSQACIIPSMVQDKLMFRIPHLYAPNLISNIPSTHNITVADIIDEYKFSFGSVRASDFEDDDSLQLPLGKKHKATVTANKTKPKPKSSSKKNSDNIWEEKWMAMFHELVGYKKKHNGSTLVSQHALEYHRLGDWVKTQRRQYVKNQLSKKRIKLLDSIGFVWKVYVTTWKSMFDKLVEYKRAHPGRFSTFVPRKQYPKLGEWVNTQRTIYMRNELCEERVKLLESIGFVWKDINLNKWMDMFDMLVEYKNEHPGYKSTMVPNPFKKNPKLGEWVRTQRVMYTKNELPESRIKLLNSIGFVWKAYSSKWMEMYERLLEYQKEHGSTIVPFKYEKNPSLGRWVGYNRSNCKDPERIKLLNDIGFVWDVPKTRAARAKMMNNDTNMISNKATNNDSSQMLNKSKKNTDDRN